MTLPASQPNYFDSTETGAPALNNVNGSLLEVVRACVKNGFNPKSVTSIDVVAGVATATCAAHGYTATAGKLLLIDGAGPALLNGRKQPLSVATNTFTFAAPGVADGTYTGTISAKRAPLGWTEPFSGTNKAIFARSAVEATTPALRIDDTGAAPATVASARLLAVRGATSVDAFTSRAPLEAQQAGGVHCNKGSNSVAAKPWVCVGNDRGVWLFAGDVGATHLGLSLVFFDANAYRTADVDAAVISGTGTGATTASSSSTLLQNVTISTAPSGFGSVVFKASTGVGDPLPAGGAGVNSANHFGVANANHSADPDDFVIHRPVYLKDTSAGVRGEIPGLAQLLASHAVLTGVHSVVTDLAGRKFLAVKTINFSNNGAAMFSLEDDWY